ncbi:hypothetical protein CHUAL_010927 [Chamberlinius hualienensis]
MAKFSLLWIGVVLSAMLCEGVEQQHDAEGRFLGDIIRLNPNSRVLIGLQVTLPISTFAPNWELFGRSGRSFFSRKHLWSYMHRPRSNLLTCPSQRVELEDYLYLMNIGDESCQERFICDLASDPVKYRPLSEIILPKLSYNAQQLQRESRHEDMYNTTTYYLMRAAKIGVDPNKRCDTEYKSCPKGADEMVNMWMIWGWKLVSRFIDVKFLAETSGNL